MRSPWLRSLSDKVKKFITEDKITEENLREIIRLSLSDKLSPWLTTWQPTGNHCPHGLLCHRLLIVSNMAAPTKHVHAPAVNPMTRGRAHPAATTARITPARKTAIAPRYNIFNLSFTLTSFLTCDFSQVRPLGSELPYFLFGRARQTLSLVKFEGASISSRAWLLQKC